MACSELFVLLINLANTVVRMTSNPSPKIGARAKRRPSTGPRIKVKTKRKERTIEGLKARIKV